MQIKFKKLISLIIFTQILCCIFLFLPNSTKATEKNLGEICNPATDTCKQGSCAKTNKGYECAIYVPTIGIPNSKFNTGEAYNDFGTTKPLAEYIEAIYKYAIGIVAILATIVMMIGGVVWITAAGDSGRIGEAKQWITGAVTGLVLTLCSFMILQTVNPDLVTFKAIGIKTVEKNNNNTTEQDKIGCCKTTSPFDYCSENIKESECSAKLWGLIRPSDYTVEFYENKKCANIADNKGPCI